MRQILIAVAIATALCASQAQAVMILTLSGANNSTVVDFSVSGSSIFTAQPVNFRSVVFDITGGADPFPAAIRSLDPFARFAVAGSVTITDETAGTSVAGPRIALQDAALFGDARFGIGTDDILSGSVGDVFSWSGGGSFDLAGTGLVYGDFMTGIYSGTMPIAGFDGQLIISPASVAEPGMLALLMGGLLGLGLGRRKGS